MKKNILIAVILCSILVFTTCSTLRAAFKEPVISLHSADMTNININNAQILCKIQVKNTNSFEIPLPKINWEIFLNNNSFVSGVINNNQKIKSRKTVFIDVPVKLEYLNVFRTFLSLKGSKQATYKIAMAVKFSFPVIGEKVWNLNTQGELPLPQLPRLSTPTLVVDNINSAKAEILVTVNVENPNPFQIPTPIFSYDYQLNKNSFIKGKIENEESLSPSSVTPVKFRMVVNYADLFRSLPSLVSAREVASLFVMTCDFGIPAFSGESKRFEVPGVLPIRR
jgi:LEA14-like dessication related protein